MKCKPEISIHVTQDDCPVRGNAMASGDDDLDREVENMILARLDNGDVWAWASVEVRAEFRGLQASDYLGACSYRNQRDFKRNSGYFEDMVAAATNELADLVADLQGIEIERI